jgi:Flp pilus assembly protein CpaB
MAINIENKKQIAIILFAVGLGLAAALLTAQHVQMSIKQETRALAKEFEEGKIQPLVQQVDVLSHEVKSLADKQAAVIQQQQELMAQKQGTSTPEMPASTLAIRTPPGKRALTVLIDSLSAVGGLINPGDYVDIITHLSVPPPPNTNLPPEKVTTILFQNMLVLAVGANIQSAGSYEAQQSAGALNITFAVDPEEAGLLLFAQQNSRLQLVLRSPSETDVKTIQPASWEALAEYAMDKDGMELPIPKSRAVIQPVGSGATSTSPEEVKPYIQIFRGGREL